MGTRHSSYKRLEEEHELVPASSWQKKQQESETKSEPVPEAEAKKDGEKK